MAGCLTPPMLVRAIPLRCSRSLRASAAGKSVAPRSPGAANGSASAQLRENLKMAELFNSADARPSEPLLSRAHVLHPKARQENASRRTRQERRMALSAAGCAETWRWRSCLPAPRGQAGMPALRANRARRRTRIRTRHRPLRRSSASSTTRTIVKGVPHAPAGAPRPMRMAMWSASRCAGFGLARGQRDCGVRELRNGYLMPCSRTAYFGPLWPIRSIASGCFQGRTP